MGTTGARGPRPSCPSGSERGPARSLEIPSPLTMRTRDRLRLLRALRKRKKRKTRRRRKRRNKCAGDTTEAKKNCRTTSKTAPFTVNCHLLIVLLKTNISFSFFLGDVI